MHGPQNKIGTTCSWNPNSWLVEEGTQFLILLLKLSSGDVPGYGLVIDDELHYGSSIRCGTFDNEPLNAGKEHFECVHLEVIGMYE